jgi:hypothetical protein
MNIFNKAKIINKAYKTEIFIPNILKYILIEWMGNRRFIYNKTLSIINKINNKGSSK